jgi:hypothetical protein
MIPLPQLPSADYAQVCTSTYGEIVLFLDALTVNLGRPTGTRLIFKKSVLYLYIRNKQKMKLVRYQV